MPCREVGGQVARDGANVPRDEQPPLSLCPEEDYGVWGPARQVGRVTYLYHVDGVDARRVVGLNRIPQRAAQLLVEGVAERHNSTLLRLPHLLAPPLQRFQIDLGCCRVVPLHLFVTA